ncbi:MAG: hypothetical protein NVS3B21_35450 [Acidimicrobiales bacterium]
MIEGEHEPGGTATASQVYRQPDGRERRGQSSGVDHMIHNRSRTKESPLLGLDEGGQQLRVAR